MKEKETIDIAQFKRIQIPMIRRVYPKLIVERPIRKLVMNIIRKNVGKWFK